MSFESPPPLPQPGYALASRMARDLGDLGILSVLFWLDAGLQVLGVGFLAALTVFGINEEAANNAAGQASTDAVTGQLMIWMLGAMTLLAGVMLLLKILCAYGIGQRRFRTLCMVVSAINCVAVPIGTVLGIYSLMVLSRPSVAELFRQR